MNSTGPDARQQEPAARLTDGAACDQLLPAKREHDDEVQFISSQPAKKMRLAGHEHGNGAQATESVTSPPPPSSAPAQGEQRQLNPGPSDTDRCVSAMPLGLPSHVSMAHLWDTRGASLPAMESFRFPSAHSLTSAPHPTSAAVSPKQVPPTGHAAVDQLTQDSQSEPPPSSSLSIEQVLCPSIPKPCPSTANIEPNRNQSHSVRHSDPSSVMTNANVMSKNTMVPSMPVADMSSSMSLDPFPLGSSSTNSYLQSAYGPLHMRFPMPGAMYSAGNLMPLPHGAPSLNPIMPRTTANPGFADPLYGQSSWTAASTSAIMPNWNPTLANNPPLQHPRPVRPHQMPMSTVIPSFEGSNSQPVPPQKAPCSACLAAKQQKQQSTLHGHSHRHAHGASPGGPHGNSLPSLSQLPTQPGALGLPNQYPSAVVRADTAHNVHRNSHQGQRNKDSMSIHAPAPPTYTQVQHSGIPQTNKVSSDMASQTAHGHSSGVTVAHNQNGMGTSHSSTQPFNSLTPITDSILRATRSANATTSNQPTFHVPSSIVTQRAVPSIPPANSGSKPASTRQQMATAQQRPQPKQQQQYQPTQTRHQVTPPTSIPPTPTALSTALSAAATHASSRKTHASNLLVDVAELVGTIFPYEIVARQHGTLPRKVAEALAAIVQVPLLRCATDKRRAGELGSDRMKEFREARKGWIALVREWEREDKEKTGEGEGEKDAEGETDDEALGNNAGRGPGGVHCAAKAGGQDKGSVNPRAVVQPGEPSALDVALMLPPTEMPAQVLRGDFFTGP